MRSHRRRNFDNTEISYMIGFLKCASLVVVLCWIALLLIENPPF